MSKIIFHCIGLTEEAIVLADDDKEAKSLLCGGTWSYERIGIADIDKASDVYLRVDSPRYEPSEKELDRLQQVDDIRREMEHGEDH
jgi:hypothetical protein